MGSLQCAGLQSNSTEDRGREGGHGLEERGREGLTKRNRERGREETEEVEKL